MSKNSGTSNNTTKCSAIRVLQTWRHTSILINQQKFDSQQKPQASLIFKQCNLTIDHAI